MKKLITFLSLIAFGFANVAIAAPGKETKYIPKKADYEKYPEAKKGGTLTMSILSNPKVFNPILNQDDFGTTEHQHLLWATLFYESTEDLGFYPYLASSYTISADRKTYTFILNDQAVWQDGTPITTDDIKFSFDLMMNPKTEAAATRAYWGGTTLEVIDKLTFQFKVENPKFDTFRSLTYFQPLQKKQFENEPNFNKSKGALNPVTSGPYELSAFIRDQKVEYKRKPNWWGYSIPHLKNRYNPDIITFKIVGDFNLNYERWLKGDLDVLNMSSIGAQTFVTRVRGTDKEKIGTKPGEKDLWATEIENKAPRGYSFVGWNLRNPIFQSVKTRTALAYLTNYNQIIDKVYYGFAYQTTSPFGSKTMNSDPNLRKPGKMITFDPQKAIKLLKEDGWVDNGKNLLSKKVGDKTVEFRFTVKTNSNNPLRLKIAQILKENFKAAGIEMDIRGMEWNAFLDDVDKRNFDAIILAWTATPYPNPNQTWHTDAEKNQGSNFGAYSNKKVDDLVLKANTEFDPKKRAKIMQEINRIIYEDQPYIFLAETKSMLVGFNKKVKAPVWAREYDFVPTVDIYSIAP